MEYYNQIPDYKIETTQAPPMGYPESPIPDFYTPAPEERDTRLAFLDFCKTNPAPVNQKASYYELARLAAGGRPHHGILYAALDYIDQRKDCADFVMHSILWLLFRFSDHPRLKDEFLFRAERSILMFKYWPSEPGIDSMCTWTENHQILFASAAFLAGQMFPGSLFSNSGHTGEEMIQVHRPRILKWLDLRFKTGFSEFLSNVYYDEDITALLSLVEFAQDDEIVERSKIVLDLMLLDMALNSWRGVFGSAHGRSYVHAKQDVSKDGTNNTLKILFGMGQFSTFDNMSAIPLVLSDNYQSPPMIAAIAQDLQRPEMVSKQRMGINLEEAERWGLGFEDFEDAMVYLSLEAYLHPRTVSLNIDMFDAWKWWDNAFYRVLKKNRGLLKRMRTFGILNRFTRRMEYDLCRNTREEVNIYTYRTPDYLLSTSQDYRKGYGGDQQSIWQATVGPQTACFTTHPAERESGTPNEWTGSGILPRAIQHKNVVICLYKLEKRFALNVPTTLFYTHAWLPQEKFDEIIEQDGWIFARKGDAYLALRTNVPYRWGAVEDGQAPYEVIADGKETVWICEMGRAAVNGSFKNFVEAISQAEVTFDELETCYHSPTQGRLEFDWERPLVVDGKEIDTLDYPRYENPYFQADFPPQKIEFRFKGHHLYLDWENVVRRFH